MLSVFAEVAYCFSTDKCPRAKGNESDGPADDHPEADLQEGRHGVPDLGSHHQEEPRPAATHPLGVRRPGLPERPAGHRRRRPQGERKYLKQVLRPRPRRPARVNGPLRVMVGNPQRRYRVYVAGPEQWKTWYGGITDSG
ncbi:hypothetical protein GCM10020358_74730 [Amorphoplanes nipponensis]